MRERLYELIESDEAAAMVYGRIMTIIIVASMLPLCFKDSNYLLDIVEYVCVAVFLVDYAMRWITADFKLNKGALSFVLYPFTPMAIVDLLSILPAFLALNDAFRTLRVLRLFRALRAFKLFRYSKGTAAIASAFKKQKEPLLVVLGLALGYICISAIVVFNVEPDTFESLFDAVYWAVVSLTTVGYGDLYPTTAIGRSIAMLSSLMGVAVVALPSGIITAGLLEELRSNKQESKTTDSH